METLALTSKKLLPMDELHLKLVIVIQKIIKYPELQLVGLLPRTIANKYGLQDVYLNVTYIGNLVTDSTGTVDLPYDHLKVIVEFKVEFVDTSPEARVRFDRLCNQSGNPQNHLELAGLAYAYSKKVSLIYNYLDLSDTKLCQYIQERQLEIIESTEFNLRH